MGTSHLFIVISFASILYRKLAKGSPKEDKSPYPIIILSLNMTVQSFTADELFLSFSNFSLVLIYVYGYNEFKIGKCFHEKKSVIKTNFIKPAKRR